jgi:eukaryotic-like serine/threonine-protein kinase
MDTVGGRYALDGRLGEGGMGMVYRARHLQLDKAFALKIISPAFADDGAARARFNEEAKLASSITHPNIVSVVDYGEDEKFGAYMVMELVEGEPLVAPGMVPMSVPRACDVIGQIADALDHIHKRGIVHGDVKADNILLSPEQLATGARRRSMARLLDFGLARRAGGVRDEDLVSGSPHYLAPERALGKPPTVATDIYALGVVCYLLVSGTLPFDGNIVEILLRHVQEEPEEPSKRLGQAIDPALEALILRSMAKDPTNRHRDVAAFRYELNTVMEMLELVKRRRSSGVLPKMDLPREPAVNPREQAIGAAFERSRLPQALISVDGVITYHNRAFAKMTGNVDAGVEGRLVDATSLGIALPDLIDDLRRVCADRKACERRAHVDRGPDRAPLELVLWMSPLSIPECEVHVVIRVVEVEKD